MKKNLLYKMILKIFIPIFIFVCALGGAVDLTYAAKTGESLNLVAITIDANGNVSQEGDLFGNSLWYPGKENRGILRIKNQFKRMEITNLGLQIILEKFRTQYGKELVHNSLAKNMKFTELSDDILKNKSFRELEYKSNDEKLNGHPLNDQKFTINKNGSVDLKYTLLMDEESGNELQALTAKVLLLINASEDTTTDPIPKPDPPSHHHHNDSVTDIEGHWAHDCIQTLLEHGIIHGYPDKTIRPESNITRAESAVLIGNALNIKPKNNVFSGYKDKLPKWARGHIIAVSDAKIFSGYLDETFKSTRKITREEMLIVLVRGFKKKLGADVEIVFVDKADVSDWAVEYVKIGASKKIIVGYPDGTFKPQNKITRAEAFTIICKLLGYHPQHGNEIE
ncbi:S-layer homology domain-containing protein [Lutibacter sp. B2]|nr:S-layer homology domain-containing protein [Lutibacter sp. B2]